MDFNNRLNRKAKKNPEKSTQAKEDPLCHPWFLIKDSLKHHNRTTIKNLMLLIKRKNRNRQKKENYKYKTKEKDSNKLIKGKLEKHAKHSKSWKGK